MAGLPGGGMPPQADFVQPKVPQPMGALPYSSSSATSSSSTFAAPAKKRRVSAGSASSAGGAPVSVDYGNGKVVQMEPNKRVTVKHKETGKKLAGTSAPKARQLVQWLDEHPEYEICTDPPGRIRKPRPPKAPGAGKGPKGAGGAGAKKMSGTGPKGSKVPWPLADSLESGPAGIFVSELRVLHKEANLLFQAGHFEEANKAFQEALEMAKMTVDTYERVEKELDALPPIKLRKQPSSDSASKKPKSTASRPPSLAGPAVAGQAVVKAKVSVPPPS